MSRHCGCFLWCGLFSTSFLPPFSVRAISYQFVSMDFHQTPVASASWDKGELIRFLQSKEVDAVRRVLVCQ